MSTLAKDRTKYYYCGEYSHFKDKCLNPASINEVDGDPREQQEDINDKDIEVVEEETDENQEGNGEA